MTSDRETAGTDTVSSLTRSVVGRWAQRAIVDSTRRRSIDWMHAKPFGLIEVLRQQLSAAQKLEGYPRRAILTLIPWHQVLDQGAMLVVDRTCGICEG